MQAKLISASELPWRELQGSLLTKHGFAVHVCRNAIVAIPAGMIVITLNLSESHAAALRWSVMAPAEYEPVHKTLLGMLQAFPYLKNTDYETMIGLLEAAKSGGPAGSTPAT